jgi:hypothetical protein
MVCAISEGECQMIGLVERSQTREEGEGSHEVGRMQYSA